ncbi:MAG: carboxypeptidase regulatory-like domain-containing protein [Acidobacteriaceae bacterium]|nr:carboxypeptidase regulatory-like domain-containing protein [Acidobacteriaceae bacterium]
MRLRNLLWFRRASVLACALGLLLPLGVYAATISGTVEDASGALIPSARIEISGGGLPAPLIVISDAQGHFASPDVKPGTYSVRVTHEGFEPLSTPVKVGESAAEVAVKLSIATQRQEVRVAGAAAQFANADPVYRTLRSIAPGVTLEIRDFTLRYDVASFAFKQGTITFLAPVEGIVTGAIFVGQGHLTLKPAMPIDRRDLARRIGTEQVEEDFSDVVFRFTDGSNRALIQGTRDNVPTPQAAITVFQAWKERVRQRRDALGFSKAMLGEAFSEAILTGEAMDNVDADILACLYNSNRPGFFSAYVHGVKHKDLRFYTRPRGGAIPALGSPEEVALVNFNPEGMDDGVWYLAHRLIEYQNGTASSSEERRYEKAVQYKLDTVVGNNDHLIGAAAITFEPLIDGERVLKFQMLPNLRVTRVADAEGKNLYFMQESRKADGSFYAVLPAPAKLGLRSTITVEYSGDKVIANAGVGSFYVVAREAWYPNLNGFGEHSLYDLTFRYPKKDRLISVGRLDKEWVDGNIAGSHWVTPKPVAVAGFNFGEYQEVDLPDPLTNYKIQGFYLTELPDMLRGQSALAAMAPKAMTKYALEQTRAQLQVCTHFFGRSEFDHIAITEQPNFAFGQSWPNLVYLPISAYIDSTQRWMLFGHIDNGFTEFVQEVTPHEVAHQWWGHAVGWASYHDQWLSEGFAEFSAALFLQQATGDGWRKDYIQFWDRLRARILEKNNYGTAPNDAGPLWLGLRLISPRTENAYQEVTYPKGAYVLAMLRSIMYTNQDHDKGFIEMMHDFVESHRDAPASTESFKAIAEKHMTKYMDLRGDHRLDWFFDEWVYGTEAPHYDFSYQLSNAGGGQTKLHMTVTQSQVDSDFAMLVPVFADFGKNMVRIGQVAVAGNSSKTIDVTLPSQPKKVALNAYREILER